MKKIALLMPLALVSLFTASCNGKFTVCSQAVKPEECAKEYFEEGKFNCEWKANYINYQGACVEK